MNPPLPPPGVLITIPQGHLQEAWYVRGRIRPYPGEKCPKCGDAFASIPHPIIAKEQIDLLCPKCLIRPLKVYIDGRGIRDCRGEVVGNLLKDDTGSPFYSFHSAHMLLSTIREAYKKKNFDARSYQPDKVRKYAIPRMAEEYVSALLRGGRGRGHYQQTERVLEILAEVSGGRDLRTLCGDDLQEMDKKLVKDGCTGATRKKYGQIVQAFARWFNTYHLPHGQRIEVPPLPMITVERREIGWIDTPEQETVMAAIKFENLHLAYRLLFATGARIGEVCGLQKGDLIHAERNDGICGINVQRNVTQYGKVKGTKTGEPHFKLVPVHLFSQLVETCRLKFDGDFIWKTRYGNPYTPVRLSALWHEASVGVGLNISLYAACRHSRATRKMIELQKEWMREVGRVLGDTPKIAKGYVRPIGEKRNVKKVHGDGGN
jgi:integrase